MKAVIFDVYETLVSNSSNLWLDSFANICHNQNLRINHAELWHNWWALEQQFRSRRLDRDTMVLNHPFERYQEAWNECFQRVFDSMGMQGDASEATRLCISDLGHRPVFPEVIPVLKRLSEKFALAIVSNADCSFLYPLLKFHGIQDMFRCIVSSEEARAYKPHPSIFASVVAQLGFPADQVIHVGDTLHEDVLGGKLVGVQTGWINRTKKDFNDLPGAGSELHPDFEFHTLNDLWEMLQEESVS